MESYRLSGRAQFDIVGIYKYGIKMFGQAQATTYLLALEKHCETLARRPELAASADYLAHGLKSFRYKSHVIFYIIEENQVAFIVRILGKRMGFTKHF
ncbi:type II toxin-antitoxin system RelE/ParE family toxin [Sediminicola luteus]|uniref:Toxin n=1 Tax=Sediminicola luteus TaxID=319238 RepID=A0A2A4G569_9FLAO|nr:type II toxin-antitoxin system RelE/ParE family toxin [Sediminicola luteus]PCE63583.1 hypothetical protein B7P33_15415 [Sediminicola luteus]